MAWEEIFQLRTLSTLHIKLSPATNTLINTLIPQLRHFHIRPHRVRDQKGPTREEKIATRHSATANREASCRTKQWSGVGISRRQPFRSACFDVHCYQHTNLIVLCFILAHYKNNKVFGRALVKSFVLG